jgi:hypothetical protein
MNITEENYDGEYEPVVGDKVQLDGGGEFGIETGVVISLPFLIQWDNGDEEDWGGQLGTFFQMGGEIIRK